MGSAGVKAIWMAVDLKDYELPYAIADTAEELARMLDVSVDTIRSSISHVKAGRAKRSRYVRVEVSK